ncbi:MAG: hypothetical protein AAF468_01145 [Pseudomonadota bacterium]
MKLVRLGSLEVIETGDLLERDTGRVFRLADVKILSSPDSKIRENYRQNVGDFIGNSSGFSEISVGFVENSAKTGGRFGRISGHLYGKMVSTTSVGSKTIWLQKLLLEAGIVVAEPQRRTKSVAKKEGDCRSALIRAEQRARRLKKGIWRDSATFLTSASATDFASREGRFHLVEGRVVSVGVRPRTLYLNFGRRWKTDFTVIVAKSDVKRFNGGETFFRRLESARVRVRGYLEQRDGGLIRVRHPGQIEQLSN